jgi:hypothetical protein
VVHPLQEIGNTHDFGAVRAEVLRLVRAIAPGHDTGHIEQAFDLIEAGCAGRLPGYSALLTPYHDPGHVLEVVLCSARLLHGLHLGGTQLDPLTIDACIVGALLHDSGYLMQDGEAVGTGAQFTQTHVARGVVFAERQLGKALSPELLTATGKVILTTDHRPIATLPQFDSAAQQLAAQVTATADLVGQMANREYIERLLFLYFEFREAGITLFTDVHDLLEKTDGFYKFMAGRLEGKLGGLAPHLTRHFEAERDMSRNLYTEAVTHNLDYLAMLLKEERARRFGRMKRGGIVPRAIEMLEHAG